MEPEEDVEDVMAPQLPARRGVLLLDSCHALYRVCVGQGPAAVWGWVWRHAARSFPCSCLGSCLWRWSGSLQVQLVSLDVGMYVLTAAADG